MNIEKGPFETLDITEVVMNNVEVAMNNDEVARNNDKVAMNNGNNEFRKMITNSVNKQNIILLKLNQHAVAKHNINENKG